MSTYKCDCLWPNSPNRSTVEAIESNLKRSVYANELSGLTADQKKANKNELVKHASNSLNSINIRGFNYYAFLFGVAAFHTTRLFQTKILFHELGKATIPHAAAAIGVGIAAGFVIGQSLSYDLGLYKRYKRAQKTIAKLH